VTTIMTWEIKPFVGLEPILFGMTEQHVGARAPLLGPVAARDVDADGTVTEHRAIHEPSVSYRNGEVCYIATGWQVKDVMWQGMNVYRDSPEAVLRALEAANGGAELGLGTALFRNLGIGAVGFYFQDSRSFFHLHSREQDDRCVFVVDRARCQEMVDKFSRHYKPITFHKP
jgi:hypothetical protein